MRLIDADEIPTLFDEEFKETRKLIQQGETHLDNLAEGFTEADRVIRQIPTVDAVPVVRCKDCKYFKTPLCQIEDNHDNWFCADGERKDGNDE